MKITAASGSNAPSLAELEEFYKTYKDKQAQDAEAVVQKAQEAQHSNTQATFKMMDRHAEIVKKSQEENKEYNEKRAIERLAQKRAEEHSDVLAEMVVRNEERRNLLEGMPKYM